MSRRPAIENLKERIVFSGDLDLLGLAGGQSAEICFALSNESESGYSDANRLALCHWREQYVTLEESLAAPSAFAESLFLAQRRMFNEAEVSVSDLAGSLFTQITGNPSVSVWDVAGGTSEFLIRALAEFEIDARLVEFRTTANDGHFAIEYQSSIFEKHVFYDPLYGVLFLNDQGIPASLNDIQSNLYQHGVNFEQWNFRPVKLADHDEIPVVRPLNWQLAYYSTRAYEEIIRGYFGAIILDDSAFLQPHQNFRLSLAGRQLLLETLQSREGEAAVENIFEATGALVHKSVPVAVSFSAVDLDADWERYNGLIHQVKYQSADRQIYASWISQYEDISGIRLDSRSAPGLLMSAMRNMTLTAQSSARDQGQSLWNLISADPTSVYWSSGSDSADFMLRGLKSFGVPANVVMLLNSDRQTYQVLEFYSSEHSKNVLYDPLYGVLLLNSAGMPAGVDDILTEIRLHGDQVANWQYQPTKIAGGDQLQTPADPRIAVYENRDYRTVLASYTNFIIQRYEDYSYLGEFLPGSTVNRGRWLVYDMTPFKTSDSLNDLAATREKIIQKYSASSGGRYVLQVFRASTYFASSNQFGLASKAENDCETTSGGDLVDQVCSWHSHYSNVSGATSEDLPLAESLMRAMRNMLSEADFDSRAPGDKLFASAIVDLESAYWDTSGGTTQMLLRIMNLFNIPARPIYLFHSSTEAHTAIEYYSSTFGKMVFYDPLYGVVLLNADGIPASVEEIIGQFAGHGNEFSRWGLQPVRLYDAPTSEYQDVDNTTVTTFRSRSYNDILRLYFNIVAVVEFPNLQSNGYIPLSANSKSWRVYDNEPIGGGTDLDFESKSIKDFRLRFDVTLGGKYSLDVFQRQISTSIPPEILVQELPQLKERYLANLGSQAEVSQLRPMFFRWLSVYMNTVSIEINASTAPRLLIEAMNSMYMSATQHEADTGRSLIELIEQDPATRSWANCGSSSDFLYLAMKAFDVPVRRVSLWHTVTDGHEAIEYFSVEYGKFVFYDPLYATHLVDSSGVPAGISEIQAEIAKYGFTPSLWKYQPSLTRSSGQLSNSAADPQYDYYRQRGYSVICRFYFNFVAVRYEDYSPLREFLPGSTIVRGRWTLYDHTAKTDLAEDEKLVRQVSIMRRFSADNGGRYYIDARKL